MKYCCPFKNWLALFWFALLLGCNSFAVAAPPKIKDLKPTVILISLDGFRADYLEKYRPKHLSQLAKQGVRAKWMIPSYPSLTFPNHYTIATGLRPENHGIVGNNMYDPESDQTFALNKREEVQNGRWWGGEPIWVTAEKQNVRAAAFFFPGTEAEIAGKRPTFWREFDDKYPNKKRVKQILAWLDLPVAERPRFLTLYFSDVDHAGHDFSPDSPEVARSIMDVDRALNQLVKGLKTRGIFEDLNLVIVSDHGMASVPLDQYVFISDHFDPKKAKRIVWGGEVIHIFPQNGEEAAIYQSLTAQPIAHARCYRKDEIPEHYHFRNNRRIGAIVCMADEGWRMTSREFYEKDRQANRLPTIMRGAHGYDHRLESMRAIFIAHGSAFKQNAIVEPFENVHVYNIIARVLNLTPAKNDGNFEAAQTVLR